MSEAVLRFSSDFVTETGAIGLGDLSKRLGLSPAEFAQASGQATESVAKNFGTEPVRLRHPEALRVAGELVEIDGLLQALGLDGEHIRKWLRTPNPALAGKTPLGLIVERHGRTLINTLMSTAMGGAGDMIRQ